MAENKQKPAKGKIPDFVVERMPPLLYTVGLSLGEVSATLLGCYAARSSLQPFANKNGPMMPDYRVV
jgi:hypothetical protein